VRLRELHEGGWISLARTDTVDTELGGKADDEERAELLRQSSGYIESLGPMVLGSSRWGHGVFSNKEDSNRIDAVYAVLFPASDRGDVSTKRGQGRLRDAMHVATAMRYGANVLVTRDARDLLRKADAIRDAFNGFAIMDPERAVAFTDRLFGRYEKRTPPA
jgi:hypothetical protein